MRIARLMVVAVLVGLAVPVAAEAMPLSDPPGDVKSRDVDILGGEVVLGGGKVALRLKLAGGLRDRDVYTFRVFGQGGERWTLRASRKDGEVVLLRPRRAAAQELPRERQAHQPPRGHQLLVHPHGRQQGALPLLGLGGLAERSPRHASGQGSPPRHGLHPVRRALSGRAARAALAALAVTAVAAACSDDPPKVQAPPRPKPIVWGFAENLHRDPPAMDRKLEVMKRMGATMVRFDLDISPEQDHAVREARADGLRVMGVVTGGSRDPQVYADRIERIVRRYAPLGVHHYEIWNEPNVAADLAHGRRSRPRHHRVHGSGASAAYPRIKAADPRSVVLVGALSRREYVGGRPNDWVEAMYEKGLKGNFDAISIHPYTDPEVPGENTRPAYSWLQMAGPWDDRAPSVRELMVEHGDGAKRVWITEFAAPTGGNLGFPVSEQRQARILERAVTLAQSYPWLGGFLWYSLRDSEGGGEQFGVLRADWTRKPAFGEYVSAIRRSRGRPAGG